MYFCFVDICYERYSDYQAVGTSGLPFPKPVLYCQRTEPTWTDESFGQVLNYHNNCE